MFEINCLVNEAFIDILFLHEWKLKCFLLPGNTLTAERLVSIKDSVQRILSKSDKSLTMKPDVEIKVRRAFHDLSPTKNN